MFERTKAWYRRNKLEVIVCGILSLMLAILFIQRSIITVGSGQEGVRWVRFFSGTQLDKTYTEGTNFIWPWDNMTLYNMRMQKVTYTYDVLAKNGIEVDIEISLHYRPIPERLTRLHKYIGQDYLDILVLPQIGSHAREMFANYQPEELFSIHRERIEQELLQKVKSHIFNDGRVHDKALGGAAQYVVFENLFITSIQLPKRVVDAIEAKEQIKQESMAYDHRLDIERKEKLRKRIEAEGIRDFQNTINDGISDKYLSWKGIDATVELSKSQNAKVVVIGGGKEGMPLILGSDYTKADTSAVTPEQTPNPSKDEGDLPAVEP